MPLSISSYLLLSDNNYNSGLPTAYQSYSSSIQVLGYNYKDLMRYAGDILNSVNKKRRVRNTKLETRRR